MATIPTNGKNHNHHSNGIVSAILQGPLLKIQLRKGMPSSEAESKVLELERIAGRLAQEHQIENIFNMKRPEFQLTTDLYITSWGRIDVWRVPSENRLTLYASDMIGRKLNKILMQEINPRV